VNGAELPHEQVAQVERLARVVAQQPEAAKFYYELAEAHWRAGDYKSYVRFFLQGYLRDPPAMNILSSALTTTYLMESAADIRDRARRLIDQDVRYAPVIAALAVAEAQLSNGDTVQYLMDYDRFLRQGRIDPPSGLSAEEFNRALSIEIKSNLTFYNSPADRAIRHAWRFDAFHRAKSPALQLLTGLLRRHASRYVNSLTPDPAHPFIASRPEEFEIAGWAVVSDGASYHESHVHSRAWATGVYYVVQPDVSRAAGSHRGWLRIGPPPALDNSISNNWKCRLIEPAPGSFVLMPGYFWHDTEPMGIDQERICVAFEIQPLELASGQDGRDD
jgi:hypothetical protein